MVKTSTAIANRFVCPKCGDKLNQDNAGRGYVAHRKNRDCPFERKERDSVFEWMSVTNDDNGSLITGAHRLNIGAKIEISDENKERTVTYVMGSDRNGWRACFKNQGAVPTGNIEWRVVNTGGEKEDSSRHFDIHSVKGITDWVATVIGIIAGLIAIFTFLQ